MTVHEPARADRLFEPVRLGALTLPNRIVMAPLTRMRVDPGGVPAAILGEYYEQRSSAGLIIAESTAAAPYGGGYGNIPGLFTAAQVAAWGGIVDRVHARGGLVAAQVFHPGRARPDSDGEGLRGPWAITHPLLAHDHTAEEVAAIPRDYAAAARRVLDAGFDGMEVHGGTGVPIDRFLRPGQNRRGDAHGGDAAGRIRLHLEIFEALSRVIPLDRVGLKLAPSALVGEAPDPWREETFALLLEKLGELGLAWIEFTRVTADEAAAGYGPGVSLEWLRAHYRGNLLAVNGFSREEAERVLAAGLADAVVFGRDFLANPDLPRRFRLRAPLNPVDPETYYTPGPRGLTDYPALAD